MITMRARRDALRRYVAGEPTVKICADLGTSNRTFHRWRVAAGIPARKNPVEVTADERRKELVDLWKSGVSVAGISARLGVCVETVQRYRRKLGLTRRWGEKRSLKIVAGLLLEGVRDDGELARAAGVCRVRAGILRSKLGATTPRRLIDTHKARELASEGLTVADIARAMGHSYCAMHAHLRRHGIEARMSGRKPTSKAHSWSRCETARIEEIRAR